MKYYIIAGEASGDLHAANLISSIKTLDPQAGFRGWGGDLMQQQGATIVRHYKDTAYMGFLEVVSHLPAIFRNLAFCKKDILTYKPDALILVDYPGFNLRIAAFIKKHLLKTTNYKLQTFYYISPQIWAWKESRVKQIKKNVDHMFVILPFEKEFYKKHNFPVHFVGHPLLDAIENYNNNQKSSAHHQISTLSNSDDPRVIALLPGSRRQEVAKMLSVMLKVIPHFPQYQFVIASAPSIPKEFYDKFTQSSVLTTPYSLLPTTYDLLSRSYAAIVTSGTATLETALFGVPQVVCYKGSRVSFFLAKRFVKVKYISLVNLIMDKKVITELIQDDLTVENLKKELEALINDQPNRNRIIADYAELKQILGGPGASAKTAQLIIDSL